MLDAQIMKTGTISITGKMNILKDVPDMDIVTLIDDLNLTELNELTRAYANLDFEKGGFKMVSEIAMKDGEFIGYVKPILSDVKIFSLKGKGKLRNKLWQGFMGLMFEITENQFKNQTSTKIPLKGHYKDLKVGFLHSILGILKNGFIHASEIEPDDSIDFDDFDQNKNVLNKVNDFLKMKL